MEPLGEKKKKKKVTPMGHIVLLDGGPLRLGRDIKLGHRKKTIAIQKKTPVNFYSLHADEKGDPSVFCNFRGAPSCLWLSQNAKLKE